MEEKLIDILWLVKEGKLHPNRGYKQILSLLGENEIVVLDAPEVKHVGLLDVRGSDASEVKETAIEQTSGAAFREMIDSGNGCDYCLGALVLPVYTKHGMRTIDCFCQSQTMKES